VPETQEEPEDRDEDEAWIRFGCLNVSRHAMTVARVATSTARAMTTFACAAAGR
jgi:hypothetical protein